MESDGEKTPNDQTADVLLVWSRVKTRNIWMKSGSLDVNSDTPICP